MITGAPVGVHRFAASRETCRLIAVRGYGSASGSKAMTHERGRKTPGRLPVAALALVVLATGRPGAAAELGLPGQLPSLQIHGFVSQGFLLTSANDYLADSSRGSFEFSEVGLNVTLPATDRLTLGLQVFSR